MGLPAEPRQKMINMMYLVLTALLALNVSSEILNAFKTVNNSLVHANEIVDDKNKGTMKSFEAKLAKAETRERAELWKPKADAVVKMSEETYAYLDELKAELKKNAGLVVENGEEHFKEDNMDVPTKLFLEGSASSRKGTELYGKLSGFKEKLLNIDPSIKEKFATSLPLDLEVPKTHGAENSKEWDYAYFHMTPVIAAITILSKFQNDVRNSEAMVLEDIHKKLGEVEVVFDTYEPLYGQSSEYLMPGQELTIRAGIGAFAKNAQPTITVDGAPAAMTPTGTAEYKTNVGGPGSYSKKLHISFLNQATNKMESKDIDVKYTVGSPTGASVSAEKVKVLYIDLDNELAISGGNVGDEKVTASMTNGKLSKISAGRYIAKPSTPGEATVTVVADGKSIPFKFKVKTVPDPIAMVGKEKGGRVLVNTIKAQQGVRAELENFVFDGVKFEVTSFKIYATGAGFPNLGMSDNTGSGVFNAESKRIISKLQPGSMLMIDDIKASGPGGTRKLPALAFTCY